MLEFVCERRLSLSLWRFFVCVFSDAILRFLRSSTYRSLPKRSVSWLSSVVCLFGLKLNWHFSPSFEFIILLAFADAILCFLLAAHVSPDAVAKAQVQLFCSMFFFIILNYYYFMMLCTWPPVTDCAMQWPLYMYANSLGYEKSIAGTNTVGVRTVQGTNCPVTVQWTFSLHESKLRIKAHGNVRCL